MRKYKHGVFNPVNKNKYNGTLPIVYRSKLEQRCMIWLDNNSNVISWGSESVVVPYIKPTDNRIHRYFIDFNVIFKNKDDSQTKYLIELKPFRQTQVPKQGMRRNMASFLKEQIDYAINMSKWNSAKQFAEKNGCKFIILTERDFSKK